MGFIDENRVSWLWPLRRSPSAEKQILDEKTESLGGGRAFDIADAMEMGFARENTADFMLPLKKLSKLFKFNIKRSEDGRQYRLFCDNGGFLMYAKVAHDNLCVEFFLYDPLDTRQKALYDPNRPAFTMKCNESHTEWRLVKEQCDDCNCRRKHLPCGCQGKLEVACIRHSKEEIGDGTGNRMDVRLASNDKDTFSHELMTKMPTWNEDLGSLVLDFKSRRVQASAKNFQLVQEQNQKHLVCQYCKIGPNSFGLDFRFPLTVIQAFGISLTTFLWT